MDKSISSALNKQGRISINTPMMVSNMEDLDFRLRFYEVYNEGKHFVYNDGHISTDYEEGIVPTLEWWDIMIPLDRFNPLNIEWSIKNNIQEGVKSLWYSNEKEENKKAKNFCVGDWVNDRGNYIKLSACDIYRISCDIYDYIKPIPISSELLKQIGFQDVGGNTFELFYDKGNLEVLLCGYDNLWHIRGRNGYNMVRVKSLFIHELQHILAICDIKTDFNLINL